jgi:hypothetical protein
LRINGLRKSRENNCPRVIAENLSTNFFCRRQIFGREAAAMKKLCCTQMVQRGEEC